MDEKLSRWGVGPVFALSALGYGALVMLVGHFFHLHFEINFLPRKVLIALGLALFGLGVPFFIASLFAVHRAYSAGTLVITGVFSCCRNPVYASWIVFLVPGIMLLQANWLGLTLPIFMYLILRILVRTEETYLAKTFGEKYLDYKKRVMCVLPFSWLRK